MVKNSSKVYIFGILTVSILIFIFYPDPLWNTSPKSLLTRVLVSYVAIPTLVAVSLLITKKLSFRSLIVDSLMISSMKMVFTASFFFLYFVPNKAGIPPEITEENKTEIKFEHYKTDRNFESGSLKGKVIFNSKRFFGVPVVSLFELKAGKSKKEKDHFVKITDCCILPNILLAQIGDKLDFENTTNQLKPVYGKVASGKNYFQKAIPPGGSVAKGIRLIKPAHIILDNNDIGTKLEEQNILVFSNPYFATLDSTNSFEFLEVPTGKTHLGIWFLAQGKNFIDLQKPEFIFDLEIKSELETKREFKIN